ncbi:hypothetical protein Tco_1144682 [Tanacetum coccineum]
MDKEKEATLLKLESSKESNVCNAGPQPVLLHMNEYSSFDEFPAATDDETSDNETTINKGNNILQAITTVVCGLANLKTWDEFGKNKAYKKAGNCADQEKGKQMFEKILEKECLPRESIRFKRSSQVVVGRLLFWASHERFVNDDGVFFKEHLLVSFDLIDHSFQVHHIDAVFRDGLTVPMWISNIGNCLILSGSRDETDSWFFYGWSLFVDARTITSFNLLFAFSTPNAVSYLLHNRTTTEEETRVNSLPQADPLNNNGLYTFRMTNESDNRITTAFKAATEEVLTSYLNLVFYYYCNVLTLISYRRHYPNIANVTHCECKHALPMNVQVSWTRINPGRRFKCCPKYDIEQQCGVFGFLDYELPSDYYKELLYNEHWENQSLKHRLRNMG